MYEMLPRLHFASASDDTARRCKTWKFIYIYILFARGNRIWPISRSQRNRDRLQQRKASCLSLVASDFFSRLRKRRRRGDLKMEGRITSEARSIALWKSSMLPAERATLSCRVISPGHHDAKRSDDIYSRSFALSSSYPTLSSVFTSQDRVVPLRPSSRSFIFPLVFDRRLSILKLSTV